MPPSTRPPDGAARVRGPGACFFAGHFLTVFCLVLTLGGNTPPYNDGKQIFDHAETIVYHGKLGIALAPGLTFYSPRPLFVSMIHVPDVALRRAVSYFVPSADALTRIMTSHIVPAALLAGTCLLFLRFLLQLSVSAGVASTSSLLLAFSTMLFVFGRVVWSDIVQAFAFWGFFSALLGAVREPTRRRAIVVGVWAGVLVNSKYLLVLSVAGGLLFAILATRALGLRKQATLLMWAACAALPFAIPIAWFNYVRTGALLHSGYAVEPFQESIFWGVYSLLFSFGKGLFLYNPLLVFAWKPSPKLPRHWWWAVAATSGPVLLLYGKYSNWGGDWSWGPRYLIFLVPVLMVPVALFLESLWSKRKRVQLALVGTIAAAGVFVQLLGAGVYWDHFIRLSQAATNQWLGSPNRSGAYTPPRGDHCDPCFEDLRGHTYLPAFQPIEGHYWLLKHALREDSWESAVRDAPWKRYTSLPLDITRRWYPWPPIDWWYLSWSGRFATAGKVLLLVLLLGTGLGVTLWVRELRRGLPRPPASPAAGSPVEAAPPRTTNVREDRAPT